MRSRSERLVVSVNCRTERGIWRSWRRRLLCCSMHLFHSHAVHVYPLQDRAGVLAQLEAPPLVLHVAESEHKKFTFEVVGGCLLQLLMNLPSILRGWQRLVCGLIFVSLRTSVGVKAWYACCIRASLLAQPSAPPFQVLFRSLHRLLMDTAAHEYLFCQVHMQAMVLCYITFDRPIRVEPLWLCPARSAMQALAAAWHCCAMRLHWSPVSCPCAGDVG